jgi:hypothetical protein
VLWILTLPLDTLLIYLALTHFHVVSAIAAWVGAAWLFFRIVCAVVRAAR